MGKRLGRVGAVSAAFVASGVAVVALAWGAPNAVAQSTGAALTMTGVHTSDAPGGTNTITLTAGDTVVFSVGPPPTRAEAPLLGYWVTLNSSNFAAAGSSSVKLKSGQTYTVDFPSAGSFSFNWTAANTLGEIRPKTGEYTSATVVVQPQPSDPPPTTDPGDGGGGNTPPGTDGSTPTSAPTGSQTGTATGTSATSGLPGLPGVPNGTFSFGSNGAGGGVIGFGGPGFNGPGADPGLHPSLVVVTNANGVVVTSAVPVNAAGGFSADTQFVADPKAATPPRALAIISILALAFVAGTYAYMYLNQRAARATHQH